MAKRPGPGRCVHCLKEVQERNWDHLIPDAWYPDSTPKELERWKVPSCIPCNDAHGRNERDLLVRLMMCIDPKDALASGMPERAIRSMNPAAATTDRDRRARAALYRTIGKEMLDAPSDGRGILPGFGRDRPGAGSRGIRISPRSLMQLGEKVVRGWTYLQTGRLIGPDYEMEISQIADDRSDPVRKLISAFGTRHERGPGVAIHWAAVPEDPICGVFVVELWGSLRIYALVAPRETPNA